MSSNQTPILTCSGLVVQIPFIKLQMITIKAKRSATVLLYHLLIDIVIKHAITSVIVLYNQSVLHPSSLCNAAA